VGFENATGAASYILENNGALARFEDIRDFSNKVLKLLSGPSIECPKKVGSLRAYVLDLLHHLSGYPRVSVVIPNYNYQRYIEARIQSVAQQTFPAYELILLDDCSTDGSVQVIKELARTIDVDTTVVVNETNSGSVFKQWRKGVNLAKGDVIWIAEADDLSEKTFLSTLLPRFQDPNLSVAYCESKMMKPDGKITCENYLSYTTGASKCFTHDYHRLGTQEISDAMCIKNTIPNVSAALFKAENLKMTLTRHQSELESLKVAGDWFLYLHLLSSGTISFCSRSLNMHRRHPSSVTSSLAKIRHLEEIALMQRLASELVSVPQAKRERASAYLEELRKQFGLSPTEAAEILLLQSNG
jgi:glycosyltransferase involved in cell wall biosynthesis